MSTAAAACRGGLSGSVSSIVADTAAGYHLLRIDGYSLTKGIPTGTALTSSQFTAAGHLWRISYYPNGDSAESAHHMSLHLLLDEKTNTTKRVKVQAQFRFRFAGRVTKQSSLVLGQDMEPHVFKSLLTFIYTDSLPELEDEEADDDDGGEGDNGDGDDDGGEEGDSGGAMWPPLLAAADRYAVPRLKAICEKKLCKGIGASTVTTTLELAERHHCPELKEACLESMKAPANLKKVLAGD
ncbi:BTB/POZ and MATH domain-containing protein 1-like [Oryza brachyantha]|uniref:BTB/POZ and MATH domain-containing protein 1-like n=1 Tax=Oryza brachyantha TaxID=4533 RepID=UPI001ADACE82|nr:BTB/POZ and MATH domain-containing protein 1-like [Oryza brachyantha]